MKNVNLQNLEIGGENLVLFYCLVADEAEWGWHSLVPRLSRNANMYRGESLVSFLRKHDLIKIWLNRKATLCMLFNPLCSVCDIRPPIARYVARYVWSFFCSESRVLPHTIKVVLPRVYLWSFWHDKNTRASSPRLYNFSVRVPERGSLGMRLSGY